MTINEVRARLVACKKARVALPLWTHIVSDSCAHLSVSELVAQYGVHRSTVYRWRRILIEEGFLEAQYGKLKAIGIDDSKTHIFSENNPSRRMARLLITQHRRHDEGFVRHNTEQVVGQWATQLTKLNSQKKRTWQEIEQAINFSQDDKFWLKHIVSAQKLVQHFDALMVGAYQHTPQEAQRVYAI